MKPRSVQVKPSVVHTILMQSAAETVESALYAKFPRQDEQHTVRRVTDVDFLVTANTPDGVKSVRVSVRKV